MYRHIGAQHCRQGRTRSWYTFRPPAACRWEPISIYKACWIESDNAAQLADFKRRKHTNMAVDKHGRDVFLADTSYGLALAQENFKDIRFHFTSEF